MEKIKNKTARLYIKDMVYGATDGIVTTFAVIASIEGAKPFQIYLAI
ncbi:MAG: hypothetical protein WBB23_19165 [Desulforhopalus sp.]